MQVGIASRVSAAWVSDDDFELRVFLARIFYASKQNGVGIGGVTACDKQAVGMHDIVIASRWCICTEREFVASDCTAHAQARIGVDVVGAEQSFGEFVEDVIVFCQ